MKKIYVKLMPPRKKAGKRKRESVALLLSLGLGEVPAAHASVRPSRPSGAPNMKYRN